MLFSRVKQVTRHIKRYRQILHIIFAHGLGDVIDALGLRKTTRLRFRSSNLSKEEFRSDSKAERIRRAIEELGTTFIKLAQIASTRADLIPQNLIEEFEKLQDTVSFIPFSELEIVLDSELGPQWKRHFSHIEEKPLAAASIAQVHRATLSDGTEVVLKVQRPGIEKTIEIDLEILSDIARRLQESGKFVELQPTAIIEEFSRALHKELDFTVELANTLLFQENFKENEHVQSPQIIRSLCSKRVLCSTFVTGVKPDARVAQHLSKEICQQAAHNGASAVMQQIFIDGFFHGDPHPGNLLIEQNGDVLFLDFGQVGRISIKDRETFATLLRHLAQRNDHSFTIKLLELTYYQKRPDINHIEQQLTEMIDTTLSKELDEIDYRALFKDILLILSKNHLTLKPHIFLMLKSMITVEGVARNLDPQFQIVTLIEKFAKELWLKRLNPKKISQDTMNHIADTLTILRDLPNDLDDLLTKARKGELKVELELTGTKDLIDTANRISDRITFAIIQAAIIIGSSLIVHAKLPPFWHDIPIIGLIGFLVAGILGFIILILIIKKQKV